MATKTFIISNAVSILGHKPIQTLDNPDQLVNAAIQAFDLLYPQVLTWNNWRFAVAIQPLVQSLERPPAPWQAVYNLPSGFLKLLRLYPNVYGWDIYNNNKIYTYWSNGFNPCDCSQNNPPPMPSPNPCDYQGYIPFSIEYVFMPDVTQLPAHFVGYFVWELAHYLGLSNAQRPDYAAYLNSQKQIQLAMACAVEAQNRPQFSQVLFPVLDNRYIGGFVGNSSGAY